VDLDTGKLIVSQPLKNCMPFMEHEDSLPYSQESANGFYPYSHNWFKMHFNIILACTSKSRKWSLPLRYTFLISLRRAMCLTYLTIIYFPKIYD
jgi:hypothetical protein